MIRRWLSAERKLHYNMYMKTGDIFPVFFS